MKDKYSRRSKEDKFVNMKETQADLESEVEGTITLAEFLESVPPNQLTRIRANVKTMGPGHNAVYRLLEPRIQLHCSSEPCNGLRFFRNADTNPKLLTESRKFWYFTYRCSNCLQETKVFSIACKIVSTDPMIIECIKLGEIPIFGPPTSSQLIKLIRPDKEMFMKGRRCENKGLGIGAFTYYRRVVENQKNRILGEIIKVCERIDAPQDNIDLLHEAINETQFKKALKMAKDAIPQSLLIDGQNPLQLLHGALSDGIHDRSDEECLTLARSVRVVLAELSENLAQILKDKADLKEAVSALINTNKD